MVSAVREAKFIDEYVAFSRLPRPEEIEEISGVFRAVVIVAERFEVPYQIEEWEKRGVAVFHLPVPDFSAPSVEQILRALRWIERHVNNGDKVLVHCVGGLGRSGTVAVAWLMYSKGLSLKNALMEVRKVKHGAVETKEQMKTLIELERTLRSEP